MLGLQLVAMFVFSALEVGRFGTTRDLAAYAQAAWLIAHGHLDPHSSLLGASFWRNNAEFALWPVALLYRLWPSPLALKWLQDLAVVGSEVVALLWVRDTLARAPSDRVPEKARILIVAAVTVVLVANPWAYQTIAFDFHFEAMAALLAIATARDLWNGRTGRMWVWVPLGLLCGASGALVLAGVGVSGVLAGRRTLVRGLVLGAVALVWLYIVGTVGGDVVLRSGGGYAYLVGPDAAHTGVLQIGLAILQHPSAVWQQLAAKWRTLGEFLVAGGLLGLLSPWGFGPALCTFVPAILLPGTTFFRPGSAFQVWPAIPFVAVGTVFVVLRLLEQGRHDARRSWFTRALPGLMVGLWVAVAIGMAATQVPLVVHTWTSISSRTAHQLSVVRARIPAGAEVVTSNAVVGSFANHTYVFMLSYGDSFTGGKAVEGQVQWAALPVESRTVVFVLVPTEGIGIPPLADSMGTVRYAEHRLGARVLSDRNGVYAFEWHPRRLGEVLRIP